MSSMNIRTSLFTGASTVIIASAMVSVSAQAQSIITNPDLDSVLTAQITAGDITAQTNADSVTALNTNFDATITSDGDITDSVLENNANVADATAMANRNGVSASLATIGSSEVAPVLGVEEEVITPGSSSDGIALSGVSINTASVDATNSGADIGTTATDFSTGSVEVSRNTTSANVLVNDGSGAFAMAINGSEPVGYDNLAETNASVTTDLAATGEGGRIANLTGTLLVSSVQIVDTDGGEGGVNSAATTTGAETSLTLETTANDSITGSATLDANAITSTFTANSRTASIGLAADDGNTSTTAAISTAQRFDANGGTGSASTDGVVSAQIVGVTGPEVTATTRFVDSSLSVSSNALSATANGNTASTQIALTDGLAFDTAAANTANAVISEASTAVSANGGLAGVNTQSVESARLAASLTGVVDVDVASPESSAIDVAGNRLIASATGNNLTAGITNGDGSAVFDSSAVLASRQELDASSVTATSTTSSISVGVGAIGDTATFADSTVTVDSNVLAATATGNRSRQSVTLEATALNASDAGSANLSVANVGGDQSVSVDGSAVIANAMINTNSQVSASNTNSNIAVSVSDVLSGDSENTAVAVNSNLQQASATGSDAGNSLSLTGVAVGSGVGIANLQTNDGTSTVTATQSAAIGVDYTSSLTSGSSEILGNNQAAIARGAVASNNLVVDAQSLALGDNGTATTTTATAAEASAAFGVVNVQEVLADVTATTGPSGTNAVSMAVAGTLTDATTTVSSNTLMAQAQGAVAANGLTLEVGSLSSATNSSGDAAIANLQNVGGADIVATVNGAGSAFIATEIGGAVGTSSVDTSGNRIMASAEGARASNVLSVSGTSLSGSVLTESVETTAGDPPVTTTTTAEVSASTVVGAAGDSVTAQFGVANTQFAGEGAVTASIGGIVAGAESLTDGAVVLTDLNGAVTSSSITSDGNLLQALASSNRATNALNVDGTSLTDVTSGLGNTQVSRQDVSAVIGFTVPGTPDVPATDGTTTGATEASPSSLSGTATGGNYNSEEGTYVNSGIATFTLSGESTLTAAEANYLTSLGFTATTGANSFTLAANTVVDVSQFDNFGLSGTTASFTGFTIPATSGTTTGGTPFIPGTPDTLLPAGVITNIAGPITSSTVSVDGNAVQGSAIGNVATNSVNITAVSADGVTVLGSGDIDAGATADADTVLASSQTLSAGSSSTTAVLTAFGIESTLNGVIEDSNLSVSGNSAFGEAIGNNVSNSLRVAGTDLASGDATSGVLTNAQDGLSADISASSEMQVSANVVSSGSNVTLDRNVNNAQGVVNNANNTLVASSTNSASSPQATVRLPDGDLDTSAAVGSFALVNGQQAAGPLTTTATTNVSNTDFAAAGTSGVLEGSVSMSSNATRSESTANRAANILAVGADANLGSTAALLNQQSSSAATTANAESNIGFDVSGVAAAVVNSSSVSIEGNSTLALARGNSAANTLSYTAGASFTGQGGTATIDGMVGGFTQANAAMLNNQSNTGPVSANATGSTFVVLNDTGGSAGALNGNVSNSNNSTTAFAVGNTATNTVALSALTTGMPTVALGSQQTNSGAVTATATTVSYTMSSNGTVGASSFQNSGNAASATAIGNSSVSVIGAN